MVQEKATIEMIQNVIKGVTPVQTTTFAQRATSDEDGNNIASTYARKRGRLFLCTVINPISNVYYGRVLKASSDNIIPPEPTTSDIALVVESMSGAQYAVGDIYQISNVTTTTESSGSVSVNIAFGEKIGNIFGASGRYRVGDYCITENATSPAAEYGGVWEQVTDRFLYGAGGTETVGETGGGSGHAHTYGVSFPEYHGAPTCNSQYAGALTGGVTGTDNIAAFTYANGQFQGDATFNAALTGEEQQQSVWLQQSVTTTSSNTELPPYRAVNIWRRVS